MVLTLGADGAALLTAAGRNVEAMHMPVLPARASNLSGAGDCLVAGFAAAKLRGSSDVEALALGQAAGAAAVQVAANVPDGLSFKVLQHQAAALLQQATRWQLPHHAAL